MVRRADRESGLEGSHALASQVTGWLLATQARLGLPGEARAGSRRPMTVLPFAMMGSREMLEALPRVVRLYATRNLRCFPTTGPATWNVSPPTAFPAQAVPAVGPGRGSA
jgi:hypothetical protein